MRWGSLGVDRWRGAIVLVVFWRVGLGIVELWNFKLVNAGEKHRDNGATPPVNTQTSPPHSPLEYTLVASAAPPPFSCVEAINSALHAQEGDLPDVRLISAYYMLYAVYQDWVHQNPGDHLDGGIAEYSKWQARWENLYVCQTNAMTHFFGKSGRDLWESCM